jgi:Chlorophyll A-B binding protein
MKNGNIDSNKKKPGSIVAEPKLGFTQYAEKLNGRLAMIGFISLIIVEATTGHGVVRLLTGL